EALDTGARRLVRIGRPLAQGVDASMHVRIVAFVIRLERVEHDPRLLAGRRAVEVHEGLPVDFLVQRREILADPGHGEAGRGGARSLCITRADHDLSSPTFAGRSRASKSRSRRARRGSTAIRSITWRANP